MYKKEIEWLEGWGGRSKKEMKEAVMGGARDGGESWKNKQCGVNAVDALGCKVCTHNNQIKSNKRKEGPTAEQQKAESKKQKDREKRGTSYKSRTAAV
jgi:hypothetical protein